MENQFYKTVPVSEGLPEINTTVYATSVRGYKNSPPLITAWYDGKHWYSTQMNEDEEINVTAWLRPVPLTLPEEVSDEALEKELLSMTGEYHNGIPIPKYSYDDDQSDAFIDGAKHIRSVLSPAFASLQEENERLRKHLNTECLRGGALKGQNEMLRAAVKKARGTLGYGELETLPSTIKSVREILDESLTSK